MRPETNEEKTERLNSNYAARVYLIKENDPETIIPDAEELISETMQLLTRLEARIIRSTMRGKFTDDNILELQNRLGYAWDELHKASELIPTIKNQFLK